MRMGEIRALTPAQVHDDYIEVNAAWGEYDGRKSTRSAQQVVDIFPADDGNVFFLRNT